MYTFEKSGGVPREDRRMEAFREVLEECQLEDIGYSGVWFTWERGNFVNNNIRERLDRGVANEKWRSLFPIYKIFHLPHSISDHCPLLLNIEDENTQVGNTHFKFEAWWITEESLEKEIRDCWESNTDPISEKLKKLQLHLGAWAKTIKVKRAGLKKKLTKELEELMAKDSDDDTIARIISTRVDLNIKIDRDEIYWEQRARANWLKAGDKNSAFFHRFASSQKKLNAISRAGNPSYLLRGINRNISSDQNVALSAAYTEEEVSSALKGMVPTKAPGPDGKDVTKFCLGILNTDQGFEQLNSTDIVLIPKTQNPITLASFRPISLCLVLYKIVTKVIANRLQEVIEECIDRAQSAFIPERLISDNVLIAYEILHTFRKKRTGKKGYMAVKLDMSKAYDRVEWVSINGKRGRVFQGSRGLRQRDPLSSFLFLLCSEGLSALIRLAKEDGLIKGAKTSRRGPEISHLLFADDCILFGEATKEGAGQLKRILKEYEKCSGQCVNFNKSTIFYSSNTLEASKREILSILGVRSSNEMERYLGLPNVIGRRKKESFQSLKEKLQLRIKGWSNRFLSQ
ncbi:reverse transcriptase [Gossypium australe]|uniref:Reverse transcriptase n=1 Tax=Gossypium australe TaxID=47621 RepID=A0A5B6X8K2_9ROSI|nr:reverse transcriptase [Gossypium australe]